MGGEGFDYYRERIGFDADGNGGFNVPVALISPSSRGVLLFVGGVCALLSSVCAAGEWQALFDGKSTAAWRTLGKPADAPVSWRVEDGALSWVKGGGNLATRETYANFELELEWKISAGGNSGVLFRVDPAAARPPFSGPEIQILDDTTHKDGRSPLTSSGALYALYAPKTAAAKPAGSWNQLRLRVQGGRVQSWLNGSLTVDAEIGSRDWNERVATSKFSPHPEFAQTPAGVIVLQDHSNPVWFRAIRIRRL